MVEIKQMLVAVVAGGARSGIKLSGLIGVTIHNTDNWSKGAGAINHGTYLQSGGSTNQTSWHYAVDDKMATQSIPENEVAWHAGDGGNGSGNTKTIAIEICVNPDSDLATATDNAAQLTADILKRHGLPATAVYQHHDWMNKNCPSQIRAGKPYDWATFKAKVATYYGGNESATEEPKQPVPSEEKYEVGTNVCVNRIWSQSNGGQEHTGDWSGTITRVIQGAEHPYLIDDGNIGWTNDDAIDTDPHVPGSSTPTPEPSQPSGPKYGVGTKVTFTGLWTGSNGGVWYPKGSLLVKQGIITKVVTGAEHPYLIGVDLGWANDQCIDDEPTYYK